MAEIAVIVPVYNVEPYLLRCCRSVLNQRFQDLEMILVDDGSTDGSPALCDKIAQSDPRVHVIHQENGGLSAARNTGIEWMLSHSDSHFSMFLDSDDWIHKECLYRLHATLHQSKADMAFCEFQRVKEDVEDGPLGDILPDILDPESAYIAYYGICMTACCKLIPRKMLEFLRFPEGKLHEDCFVTHRILFEACKVAVLQEPLYYYYYNPESITRKTWKPKRLEELEAHDIRMAYLREHGYEKAALREQQIIIETVYEHVEALAYLKDPALSPYLKDLRRRLRQELGRGRELISLNSETIWIYLMAYPAKPLWYFLKKAQDLWHRLHGTE